MKSRMVTTCLSVGQSPGTRPQTLGILIPAARNLSPSYAGSLSDYSFIRQLFLSVSGATALIAARRADDITKSYNN